MTEAIVQWVAYSKFVRLEVIDIDDGHDLAIVFHEELGLVVAQNAQLSRLRDLLRTAPAR